jgi:hypothetical protein
MSFSMNNLTTQQLNDLYVCVSTRCQDILKGYNEITVEDAPKHVLDESDRLQELLDLIWLELKLMK